MKPKVSKFFGNHSCAIINEFWVFADRSSEKIHIGSITILDFFIPLELEQREREKAEHCVCEEESFESYGFLLKRKVLFENWKHCERGQTYLQRKHGSNSEGLSADRVLLPSLYGENLYTHRSLSDENPEK
ncbi:hypothetical protein TNCT_338941 [Trichonephila clavata]|uniref:Uncharacterized protein n=1 Tax=Trichonephila clavata TaxID=2740835 RepID=A0A8X6EY08_TRICU|nr:hypothetical protein TNCT_338941 [Trichonephila clavata]